MLYDPKQIKILREALHIAEQALSFGSSHPDEKTRRGLARSILFTAAGGSANSLVMASIALRAYSTRPADAA